MLFVCLFLSIHIIGCSVSTDPNVSSTSTPGSDCENLTAEKDEKRGISDEIIRNDRGRKRGYLGDVLSNWCLNPNFIKEKPNGECSSESGNTILNMCSDDNPYGDSEEARDESLLSQEPQNSFDAADILDMDFDPDLLLNFIDGEPNFIDEILNKEEKETVETSSGRSHHGPPKFKTAFHEEPKDEAGMREIVNSSEIEQTSAGSNTRDQATDSGNKTQSIEEPPPKIRKNENITKNEKITTSALVCKKKKNSKIKSSGSKSSNKDSPNSKKLLAKKNQKGRNCCNLLSKIVFSISSQQSTVLKLKENVNCYYIEKIKNFDFCFTIEEDKKDFIQEEGHTLTLKFLENEYYDFKNVFYFDFLDDFIVTNEAFLENKDFISGKEIIDFLEVPNDEIPYFVYESYHHLLNKKVLFNDGFYEEMKNLFVVISQNNIMLSILPEYRVFDIVKNRDFFLDNNNNIQKLSKFLKLFIFTTKMHLLLKYLGFTRLSCDNFIEFKNISFFIYAFRATILKKTKILWKELLLIIYLRMSESDRNHKNTISALTYKDKYFESFRYKYIQHKNTHSYLLRMLFINNYSDILPAYNEKFDDVAFKKNNNAKENIIANICKRLEFYLYFAIYVPGHKMRPYFSFYIKSKKKQTRNYLNIYNNYIQELRKKDFYNNFFKDFDNLPINEEFYDCIKGVEKKTLIKTKPGVHFDKEVEMSLLVLRVLNLFELEYYKKY